jgi:hypothetical protein
MILKISKMSWEEALRSLQNFLPGVKSLGLDEISRAMEQQNCRPQWNSLADWAELDDAALFRKAFGQNLIRESDGGILIPDLCFWDKHLPFLVKGDFLEKFVETFLVQFGEAFFNGDTVIVFPSIKTLCLFHHNGIYLKYKFE